MYQENLCGINYGFQMYLSKADWLLAFIDETKDPIEEAEKIFHFSNWYPFLDNDIKTPKSYMIKISELESKGSNIIKLLKDQCFVRLDTASPKKIQKHNSIKTIPDYLNSSERTRESFKDPNHMIIFREWIECNSNNEIRCFVKDKILRGISGPYNCKPLISKKSIINLVNKIVKQTEFDDCSIDLLIDNDELILIEINSPCYLFASSGLFTLHNPEHQMILFEPISEYINYPIWIYQNNEIL